MRLNELIEKLQQRAEYLNNPEVRFADHVYSENNYDINLILAMFDGESGTTTVYLTQDEHCKFNWPSFGENLEPCTKPAKPNSHYCAEHHQRVFGHRPTGYLTDATIDRHQKESE